MFIFHCIHINLHLEGPFFVRALSYQSEDWGFTSRLCYTTTVVSLSMTDNPVCSRGCHTVPNICVCVHVQINILYCVTVIFSTCLGTQHKALQYMAVACTFSKINLDGILIQKSVICT